VNKKLEVDRRRIHERISRISHDLKILDRKRIDQIQKKREKDFPIIAFVGYTNAGKSSLFNVLTDASVSVKSKLFSTLDTTTRLFLLAGNLKALLVDTVGFVRELPHHLVESFKTTLEEAIHADILLHVIDSSRHDILFIEKAVKDILGKLGAVDKNIILVFNKIDLLSKEQKENLASHNSLTEASFVSAATGEGMDTFLGKIASLLDAYRSEVEVFVPNEKLGLTHYLYEEGEILHREDTSNGSAFRVKLTPKAKRTFIGKLLS